jgi:large subunit ribosomal protein L15
MSLNRRKKAIKFRGHHTHGYGSKKKHRGSGHQGGVGMAGTGKKADQKKPNIWKDTKYFGRNSLKPQGKYVKTLNLFYFEEHFDSLVKSGQIKKEADTYNINLKDFDANKLLGSGEVTHKYKIACDFASKSAVAKVEEKGGSVTIKPLLVRAAVEEQSTNKSSKAAKKK